jgi:hypothetical protein
MTLMTRTRTLRAVLAGVLLWTLARGSALAEGFDIGAGLGFVNHSQGFEGGWDVQVGYEFIQTDRFNIGVQWQWLRGWTSEDSLGTEEGMSFRSNALYLTTRPTSRALRWLQFKAGVINADYKIAEFDYDSGNVQIRADRSGATGLALGLGVVVGSDKVRIHVFDYQRFEIGGESFDTFSISLAVLGGVF